MMNQTTFLDWVDLRQTFTPGPDGNELPIVGGGVVASGAKCEEVEIDGQRFMVLTPGEKDGYSVKRLHARGSYDTSLLLRCNGLSVEMSGNVGRWERPDNIWNYDMAGSITRASQIAKAYGLPAFTPGECFERQTISEHDQERGVNPWVWSGAHFQEMHVTRNFYAGNEAMAVEAMRYMGGLRAARVAKGRFGDETLIFGKQHGKLHKRIVVYRKAAEMLAHAKGDEAKKVIKDSQEYQFARDMGLVRIECKWGRDFLRENNLRFLGDHCENKDGILGEPTMGKVIRIFEKETDFLLNIEPDRAARLVSDMPIKVRMAALSWIRGDDLRQLMSRATFYRTVKALRDYGIDAAEPRNVEGRPNCEEALQRMLDALPSFQLKELPAPEWYGLPDLQEAA